MPVRRSIAIFALVLIACSGDDSPARFRSEIEPHLDVFGDFDRWARRLSLADSAFRSEEALAEAAFAPLRDDARVLAAWLDREGPDPAHLAHPEGLAPPPSEGWVRVRTEELGELEARRATLEKGDRPRSCLLIRRSAPAPGSAILHVTLAFPSDD
jgi:hypothetical protein